MEARIARLESDVAHLRTDVADIKVDLRSVRDKLDALNENVATTKLELTSTLAGTKHDLADAIHSAVVWALFLYLGLAAVLLSTMARAFGWI